MEWLGLKHPMLAHLPFAAALLLPLPLLLAQRAGRGIRPWWVVSRYLAWMAFLGLLTALPSGMAYAKVLGRMPGGGWTAPAGSLLYRHQILALASFFLAPATLWSLYRKRKDHEGLGWSAFFLGTLWAASSTLAGLAGDHLAHRQAASLSPPAAMAPPSSDPEQERPVRALDFAAMRPVQTEPVKSQAHGGRWVRTWLSSSAMAAFQDGQALPPGTLVVLSSQEDRWGRPGPDPGPLWAYEIQADGKPAFQFYWAFVPEAWRQEVGGAERVYWRKDALQLRACLVCHAQVPSSPAQRARLFRRPRGSVSAAPAGEEEEKGAP